MPRRSDPLEPVPVVALRYLLEGRTSRAAVVLWAMVDMPDVDAGTKAELRRLLDARVPHWRGLPAFPLEGHRPVSPPRRPRDPGPSEGPPAA